MLAIRYEAPRSVAEAVRLIAADPAARVLAGGTDLLVQFKAGGRLPSAFVDVKRIPELIGVAIDAGGLHLGAATPAAVLTEHVELRRLWPGLAEAVHLIGSVQIQGRGSVGVTVDADGVCNAARVAIGAVAPTALLVPEAAKALVGSRLDDVALKRAAEASSAAARPIDDKRGTTAYRRTIAGVLTRRAAAIAKQRVVS